MKANPDATTFHPLRDALDAPRRHDADAARGGRTAAYLRFRRDADPASECELDAEQAKPLIAAIAHELWKLHGGNDVLNWLEAEILLQNALAEDESNRGHRTARRG